MTQPRTFVGFSSTDIGYFRLMLAWKEHEHIDFNFTNVQLPAALDSTDPAYIKRRCREQIDQAGTYALIIGKDTWSKTAYVKWEVEVAIEKNCRLIGVNIDDWRILNPQTCPDFFKNRGALFVPFSAPIIQRALQPWTRQVQSPWLPDDWYFSEGTYASLRYVLDGNMAKLAPKPPPFMTGRF